MYDPEDIVLFIGLILCLIGLQTGKILMASTGVILAYISILGISLKREIRNIEEAI